MSKNNRTCLTCGEKYSYCHTCNKKDPAWKAEFHSETCKDIFDICVRYNMKLMDKAAAKDALLLCDLSNKDNFVDCVKHDLEVIFAEDHPKAKRGKKTEAKPIEEVIVEQVAIEPEIHEVVNKTEE